jgi:hypothetical protein
MGWRCRRSRSRWAHERYRYGKRPRSHAYALREAVHQRLRAHQASRDLRTPNRFLLYELRQYNPGALYGHKSRGQGRSEAQNLTDASKWLRDAGIVPWPWIVDETRSLRQRAAMTPERDPSDVGGQEVSARIPRVPPLPVP